MLGWIEGLRIKMHKIPITREILNRNQNIRLMDDKQFEMWGALYVDMIDDFSRNDWGPDIIYDCITHGFMPQNFRQDPFAPYWEDDFWKIRCCLMMLMYFANKHKDKWQDVREARRIIKPDLLGLCYIDTLFEAKFKAFIKESYENLSIDGQDEDAPMFANDFTIMRIHEKYSKPIGQDVDERFVDFEIYDDPMDPIRLTSVFEMDEQSDLIKKAIRWKKKQLEMLIKSPHFEPDDEREKKAKWKKQRRKNINEWEDLIYDMTKSSRDINEVYSEWKGAGHEVIEASNELDYLLYGCDDEDGVITDESSTEAGLTFPIGHSFKKNGSSAEGIFQAS
jgi:hypothetical protein